MDTNATPEERIAALLAQDPATLTEQELDELERAGHPRPRQSQMPDDPPPPAVKKLSPRAPEGASKDQLERVQKRNQELLDGAEAGPVGEREVGVGRSVSTEPPRTDSAPD